MPANTRNRTRGQCRFMGVYSQVSIKRSCCRIRRGGRGPADPPARGASISSDATSPITSPPTSSRPHLRSLQQWPNLDLAEEDLGHLRLDEDLPFREA